MKLVKFELPMTTESKIEFWGYENSSVSLSYNLNADGTIKKLELKIEDTRETSLPEEKSGREFTQSSSILNT